MLEIFFEITEKKRAPLTNEFFVSFLCEACNKSVAGIGESDVFVENFHKSGLLGSFKAFDYDLADLFTGFDFVVGDIVLHRIIISNNPDRMG